ncbi:MAG: septum formation initiator precursor [Rhodobacterales bacterium]|nr:MAG: septum formation initiator precursor [Rhodobacterales bacterium]
MAEVTEAGQTLEWAPCGRTGKAPEGRRVGKNGTRTSLGGVIYFLGIISAGLYFTFAAVQGDYGLFQRVRILAEAEALKTQRDALQAQVTDLTNKTHRLSDDYLDLDLLDEQAREVLGMVRADEIVLR